MPSFVRLGMPSVPLHTGGTVCVLNMLTRGCIATPQVDAIIRLSEAHARLHLNEFVRESDVDMAIRIIVSSFVETQKFSVAKQMARTFSEFINHKKDTDDLLCFVLNQMVQDELRYVGAPFVVFFCLLLSFLSALFLFFFCSLHFFFVHLLPFFPSPVMRFY